MTTTEDHDDVHPVTRASWRPEHPDVIATLLSPGRTGGAEALLLNQEAAGGRALLESSLIPKDRGWQRDGEPPIDDAWLALGFTFGADVDDLFEECTLPDGWSRNDGGYSDPRGSVIVDERGVKRVGVFYKAAFYDRKASAHLVNVGWDIASSAIYGDGDVEVKHLDVLTDAERADCVQHLCEYLGDAVQNPTIYGDRADRARAALSLLGVPDAEPIIKVRF